MRAPAARLPAGAFLAAAFHLLAPGAGSGQDQPPRWERRLEASQPRVTIFHSPLAIHLPTAETLSDGDWQFEISHRFFPAVSEGADALWGLDGPVNMRLGLGYALSDRALLTAARSNVQDNWDLQLKVRAAEGRLKSVPFMVGILGGVALSSDVEDRDAFDAENVQYYGELILNALLGARWALGVVPIYVRNVQVQEEGAEGDFLLGMNTRVQLTEMLSLEGEWINGPGREGLEHDPATVGIELETGGHFFKIFLTNSIHLNPGQALPGSPYPFQGDDLRLGFTITRLIR